MDPGHDKDGILSLPVSKLITHLQSSVWIQDRRVKHRSLEQGWLDREIDSREYIDTHSHVHHRLAFYKMQSN